MNNLSQLFLTSLNNINNRVIFLLYFSSSSRETLLHVKFSGHVLYVYMCFEMESVDRALCTNGMKKKSLNEHKSPTMCVRFCVYALLCVIWAKYPLNSFCLFVHCVCKPPKHRLNIVQYIAHTHTHMHTCLVALSSVYLAPSFAPAGHLVMM